MQGEVQDEGQEQEQEQEQGQAPPEGAEISFHGLRDSPLTPRLLPLGGLLQGEVQEEEQGQGQEEQGQEEQGQGQEQGQEQASPAGAALSFHGLLNL